jgi:hypothetical protein
MNLKHVSILKQIVTITPPTMNFLSLQKITTLVSQFTCFRIKNDVIMCGTTGIIKMYDLITGKQVIYFTYLT